METSDRSVKENIHPIPDYIAADLLALAPVEFNMIGATKKQFGLIAQDVEQTSLSRIVFQNERGIRSVAYSQLISVLVLHVQQLTKRVALLESR